VAPSVSHGASGQSLRLEAERFQLRGEAQRASGGRAVLLTGRASLTRRRALPALARISVRARGARCGKRPRLAVSLGGRRIAGFALRAGRWRSYSKAVSAAAGRRTIKVELLKARRSCARRALVDYVVLGARKPAAQAPTPPPAASPAPTAAPAAVGPTFTNPVFGAFADPMALDVGNTHSDYYAYATGGNFPMARSADLVHWTSAGTAMSGRPVWAQQTGDYNPWAPTVIETGDPCPGASTGHCFVMYFVSKHASMDPPANCIGVATSSSPGGPFADRGPLQNTAASVDSSGRPIGCGDDGGYSNIDPAPFVDDGGSAYLYLSTGHRCPAPAPHAPCDWDRTISVIPLSANLLTAAGPRQALFASGAPWEASVVEGPWMRKRAGTYELFYSGGVFTGAYGMGYATASSPAGPFSKSAANPLLHDSADVKSAGGGSLVTGPGGGQWVAYHGRSGSYAAGRVLRIDRVGTGSDDAVVIDGPTSTPQPAP
jgi:hypothetical protein